MASSENELTRPILCFISVFLGVGARGGETEITRNGGSSPVDASGGQAEGPGNSDGFEIAASGGASSGGADAESDSAACPEDCGPCQTGYACVAESSFARLPLITTCLKVCDTTTERPLRLSRFALPR
jgi:hypothetical protein